VIHHADAVVLIRSEARLLVGSRSRTSVGHRPDHGLSGREPRAPRRAGIARRAGSAARRDDASLPAGSGGGWRTLNGLEDVASRVRHAIWSRKDSNRTRRRRGTGQL